jgi:predicted CXXCH cytochrome family protein
MLAASANDVCGTCHEDVVQAAAKAAVRHGALETEASCGGCHNPHMSSERALLNDSEKDLCLSCHQDIKNLLASNSQHHGPVADGDCGACHEPHGGPNFSLLTGRYPERFYSSYSTKAYELCFGCHDSSLASRRTTTTDTGFRDGNRNLHFLHVNDTKRGRSCRACHNVHASNRPFYINETFRFGTKDITFEFTQSDSGGTCARGCHVEETYIR